MKKLWADPEFRRKMSQKTIEQWKDPVYAAAVKAGGIAARPKHLKALKSLWEDPSYRQRQSEGAKAYYGGFDHICQQCMKRFSGGGPKAKVCRECRGNSSAWRHKMMMRLLIRDGSTCKLCERPIDFELPGNHQMGPSIDHVVAFSNGGSSELENLQLAHRNCNALKGTANPGVR